jgi:release factor glutamine methyltransferase
VRDVPQLAYGPLTIRYDDRVLEPRPWTELQAVWASDLLADLPPGPVLELCTGAGHIGLRAVHGHDRRLVAVDADDAACAWAEANAAAHGIDVDVRHGDLETVLAPDELFPLVLADPPWVPTPEVERFPEDPRFAIDGGPDGLGPARTCLRVIRRHLAPGGVALLQLGNEDQVEALAAGLRAAGLDAGERLVVPDGGIVVRLDRAPGDGPA